MNFIAIFAIQRIKFVICNQLINFTFNNYA